MASRIEFVLGEHDAKIDGLTHEVRGMRGDIGEIKEYIIEERTRRQEDTRRHSRQRAVAVTAGTFAGALGTAILSWFGKGQH